MSHDDDDNEEDFASSFRRMVRATEKQISLAEAERHRIYGLEVEVSAAEMRALLIEHAKLLRAKLDVYSRMVAIGDISVETYAHHGGVDVSDPIAPGGWKRGDPIRPNEGILGQMGLQANWLIAWAARLTEEKKTFRLSIHEWASIFGRPDVVAGYPV
jgi:hypothetical protein